MSFQSYLENLRTKPEHVRNRYAWSFSFGITAIIFAFWVGSFTSAIGNNSDNNVVIATVEKAGTPGQSLTASVGSLFGDIRDIIFGPRKMEYKSTVIVGPGKK